MFDPRVEIFHSLELAHEARIGSFVVVVFGMVGVVPHVCLIAKVLCTVLPPRSFSLDPEKALMRRVEAKAPKILIRLVVTRPLRNGSWSSSMLLR